MPTCMLAAPRHAWLHRMIALFSVARSLSQPRGSHAKQQDRMHGHAAACALFVHGVCEERRHACAETSVRGEQAGKYTASSDGVRTWRLARSIPMQAEYACAMAVASLTPQRRNADRRINPTQQSAHASQPRTRVQFVHTNRYEGIIPTK